MAILPAGTGHQRLNASEDFLVVGAYPASGAYDECTSLADRKTALPAIPRVTRPRKDPVYGKDGPLMGIWRQSNRRLSYTRRISCRLPPPALRRRPLCKTRKVAVR